MHYHNNNIEYCSGCGGGKGTSPKPAPKPKPGYGGVKLPKPWGR